MTKEGKKGKAWVRRIKSIEDSSATHVAVTHCSLTNMIFLLARTQSQNEHQHMTGYASVAHDPGVSANST